MKFNDGFIDRLSEAYRKQFPKKDEDAPKGFWQHENAIVNCLMLGLLVFGGWGLFCVLVPDPAQIEPQKEAPTRTFAPTQTQTFTTAQASNEIQKAIDALNQSAPVSDHETRARTEMIRLQTEYDGRALVFRSGTKLMVHELETGKLLRVVEVK